MCGIFGYIGKKNPVDTTLKGLKKLEYRGYDSAGIAGIKEGKLYICKEVGKIEVLEREVKELGMDLDLAISHTRWATHGKPSVTNAHPQFNSDKSLALVHNGIIENHDVLRQLLKEKGVQFISETDTEVIAHLISSLYDGDILKATQQAISQLEGSFAIALIHQDFPDQIIVVAHESPLVIGMGSQEAFIASDPHAFLKHAHDAMYLSNAEIAVIKANQFEVFNSSMEPIVKEAKELSLIEEEISKREYKHFTLKEIHEQPQSIRNTLLSRYVEEQGTAIFEELTYEAEELLAIERIVILGCGTSWHAGYVASYIIKELVRIPVDVEISSEYRYMNPIIGPGTLFIAISQSGETADTLAAIQKVKAKKAKVMGICNVHNSSLARETDCTLFLKAGTEIGVCSTKAFTSQVVVLALFSLLLARMKGMKEKEGKAFLNSLKILPEQAQTILHQSEHIHTLAKQYASYNNFFFIGRRYMYPTALEGALKLKEISYINANGYPAGEMKHGPIALINEECPTVALCANKHTYKKLLSNLMEIKARNGKVIAIAEEGDEGIESIADEIIWIPRTIDELAAIPTTIATQLFAYYVALERGEDIDQPRNLAKSVTVE